MCVRKFQDFSENLKNLSFEDFNKFLKEFQIFFHSQLKGEVQQSIFYAFD